MCTHFHGGDLERTALLLRTRKELLIDFSASINPLPLPDTIRITSYHIRNYPPPLPERINSLIASKLKISPGYVLTGNGSIELIYLICNTLRPREAIIFSPSFSEYERALRNTGSRIKFREPGDFSAPSKRTDIVFICNPNNPTAQLFRKEEILRFARSSEKTLYVVDEAFMDFVHHPGKHSVASGLRRQKNVILLGSLTKFLGIPGLRLGYMAARPETVLPFAKRQYPWAVNYPAIFAAEILLKDADFARKSRDLVFRERAAMFSELSAINGLLTYPPTANFIFCRITAPGITASRLNAILSKKNILIRDCSNFRGLDQKSFRIAVKTASENTALLTELRSIFDKCK